MTRAKNNSSDIFLGCWFLLVFGGSNMHAVIIILVIFSIGSFRDKISVTDWHWSFDCVINMVLVLIDSVNDFEVSNVLLPSRSQFRIHKHLPDIGNWDINLSISLNNSNTSFILQRS